MYPVINNNEFMQQKPITDGNVVHVFSYNTTAIIYGPYIKVGSPSPYLTQIQ